MIFGAKPGIYALDPQALGLECIIDMVRNSAVHEVTSGVAVVHVHGPLAYAPGECESYAGVLLRVRSALNDARAHTVVLHIDSPGGDVAGAFDTARMLRASVPAGKRLLAFSDSRCCSAAYALACAASEIHCSSTAIVGSVGVISVMQSAARAAEMQGLQTAVITSGRRKADGNPLIPITDEAVAAAQLHVDVMAGEFARWVASTRPINEAQVQALECAVFVGSGAVAVGLADQVAESLEAMVAYAQQPPKLSTEPSMPADEDKKDDKPAEDAVRAALVTASTSDDPEKAARAKAALAAYDGPGDDEEPKKKKDEDAAAAAVVAAAAPLAAQVQALSGEIAAMKAASAAKESSEFFASCAHLDAKLLGTLRGLPLVQAKAIVATLPRPVAPAELAAQPAVVPASSQASGPRSDPATQARMAAAFGVTKATLAKAEFDSVTNVQTFGRVAAVEKK